MLGGAKTPERWKSRRKVYSAGTSVSGSWNDRDMSAQWLIEPPLLLIYEPLRESTLDVIRLDLNTCWPNSGEISPPEQSEALP